VCEDRDVTLGPSPLGELEEAYLAAREARDRLDVAKATGEPSDPTALAGLEAASAAAAAAFERLASLPAALIATLGPDDRRALEAMRTAAAVAETPSVPIGRILAAGECADDEAWRAAITSGGRALQVRLEACYTTAAGVLDIGNGETLTRPEVLERLATEPDARRRRSLFLALEPLWRAVNGDDAAGSPYRAYVRDAAAAWLAKHDATGEDPGIGLTRHEIEGWSVAVLDGWKAAVVDPARVRGEPPVEPWDWWWRAGDAQRAIGRIDLDRAMAVNRAFFASLGADLHELNVRFDVTARPARPPVPVAFTTFGARPRLRADGTWSPGQPVVLETLAGGGLGDMAELVHETGHAIHIAGIRTRPAFADWPDSDALTEALADVPAYDLAEPAWQRRWLPDAPPIPEAVSIRCWYAGVALDAAWALFEVRMLLDPSQRPNEVWTDITSTWLGIAPHPEWSWWAIRGQLVQEAGYMANYAAGAVLATAIRAAVRRVRGDWLGGDPGWYAWVRDAVYRHGLERRSRNVVEALLGGPATSDALLAEIARAARST
jgi:hypothetical protein